MRNSIIIFGFFLINLAFSQEAIVVNSLNKYVKVKNDPFNYRKIFYLSDDKEKIIDSLCISDMNFSLDSLVKLNENKFLYFFSKRCGFSCKTKYQIIFTWNKARICIEFISYFETYAVFSQKNNIGVNSINHENIFLLKYLVNNYKVDKQIGITEYFYKGEDLLKKKMTTFKYIALFNSKDSTYYTNSLNLKGKYIFYNSMNKPIKQSILNISVKALNYSQSSFVKYDNVWYEVDKSNNNLTAIID